MKNFAALVALFTGLSAFADPAIEVHSVTQSVPWYGKVSINYTVAGVADPSDYHVRFSLVKDDVTICECGLFDDAAFLANASNGTFTAVWDGNADGKSVLLDGGKLRAELVRDDGDKGASPYSIHKVIDLSAGSSAAGYGVAYVYGRPTTDFASDEYKTSKLVLKRIKAGSFMMGSSDEDAAAERQYIPNDQVVNLGQETLHRVTFTNDFYLGVYPVTERQYDCVKGDGGSGTTPKVSVSYGAVRGSSIKSTSFIGLLREKAGGDYELPTEAQWEYAARAGTTNCNWFGAFTTDSVFLNKYIDYGYQTLASVVLNPVGGRVANPWGLYDMVGGVMEICRDRIAAKSESDPGSADQIEPCGAKVGGNVAVRGGRMDKIPYDAGASAAYARTATRNCEFSVNAVSECMGFRLSETVPAGVAGSAVATNEIAASISFEGGNGLVERGEAEIANWKTPAVGRALTVADGFTAAFFRYDLDSDINHATLVASGTSYTPATDDLRHWFQAVVYDSKGVYAVTKPMWLSRLPVLYMTTDDGETPTVAEKAAGVGHSGTVRLQGNELYADESGCYDGAMEKVSIRGNMSSVFPKPNWKVKLGKKCDLLGIGGAASKHWVLNGLWSDTSLMRDKSVYGFSDALGLEAMDRAWVEVFFNGKLRGIYLLEEQIRVGSGRVDIFDWESEAEDMAAKVAAGKYPDDPEAAAELESALAVAMVQNLGWATTGSATANGTRYRFSDYGVELPAYDFSGGWLIEHALNMDVQTQYWTDQIGTLKVPVMVESPEYMWTQTKIYNDLKNTEFQYWSALEAVDGYYKGTHYSEIADFDSMVSYLLVKLFCVQYDPSNSRWCSKDVGGKIKWGPVWDFDGGVGGTTTSTVDWGITTNAAGEVVKICKGWNQHPTNGWYHARQLLSGTSLEECQRNGIFYQSWMDDPYFCMKFREKWLSVTNYVDALCKDGGIIDTDIEYLHDAAAVNTALWPNYGGTNYWSMAGANGNMAIPFDGPYGDAPWVKEFYRARYDWVNKEFKSVASAIRSLKMNCSRWPYTDAKDQYALTVTSEHTVRENSIEEGTPDLIVPGDADFTATMTTSDSAVKTIGVYVNGILNGKYSVSGGAASFTVTPEEFTSATGAMNMISFIGFDAAGEKSSTTYALVEQLAVPVTDWQANHVRLWGFAGQPKEGNDGWGEFIILTNLNQETDISLTGLGIRICKCGDSVAKCQFTITNDLTIAAGGWVRLDYNDYCDQGWVKITDGDVTIDVTSVYGASCDHFDKISQKNLGVKGTGNFAVRDFTNDSWGAMAIADAPCLRDPEIVNNVVSGYFRNPVTISSSTNTLVVLENYETAKTLTLTGLVENVVFTVELRGENAINVEDNTPAVDATGADIVITGEGSAEFFTTKRIKDGGIVQCRNLTVLGGDTFVKYDQDKPDTACVAMSGDYLQRDGAFKVSMPKRDSTNEFWGVKLKANHNFTLEGGVFECKVAGTKSAAVKLKDTGVATLSGGTFKGKVRGPNARMISGGRQIFSGTDVTVAVDDEVAADTTYHARCFNADGSIAVSGGVFDVNVPADDSEIFSTDDSIAVSGGRLSLVAGDDCMNAATNIVVTDGWIYAESKGGDGLDANHDITVDGGLILAYAFADEEKGLDVNNEGVSAEEAGTLTVNGGYIVSLGGPGSHFQGKFVSTVNVFKGAQLDPAGYSGRYLELHGVNAAGSNETFTVKLPAITGSDFSILCTMPGMEEIAAPSFAETYPPTGRCNFHDIWLNDGNQPVDPEPEEEGPECAKGNYVLRRSGAWQDESTWWHHEDNTWPELTTDIVAVNSYTKEGAVLDLEGTTATIGNLNYLADRGVVITNGSLRAVGGADTIINQSSGILRFANASLADPSGFYVLNCNGAGFEFSGDCTVKGSLFQFRNIDLLDPTATFRLVVRDGTTTFETPWSHDNSLVKSPEVVCAVTNGHLVATQPINALDVKWSFDVRLGENNTTNGTAAVKLSSITSTTKPAIHVDARGKLPGKYPILNASFAGQFADLDPALVTVDVDPAYSNKVKVAASMIYAIVVDPAGGEIEEDPTDCERGEFVVHQSGDWASADSWYHNAADTYPQESGHYVRIEDTTAEGATLDLHGATNVINSIKNLSAKGVEIANGHFDLMAAGDGVVNSAPGYLCFRDVTFGHETSAASYVLKGRDAGLLFKGDCSIDGTAQSLLKFYNLDIEEPALTTMRLGVADGTLDVNIGWSHVYDVVGTEPNIQICITNGHLNASKSINALGVTWNYYIKLGANNTEGTSAVYVPAGIQSSAEPMFRVDASGVEPGTYTIIKGQLGGKYIGLATKRVLVTVDADRMEKTYKVVATANKIEITVYALGETPPTPSPTDCEEGEFIVKRSGQWENEATWYHNAANVYPEDSSQTIEIIAETETNAVVELGCERIVSSVLNSAPCNVTFANGVLRCEGSGGIRNEGKGFLNFEDVDLGYQYSTTVYAMSVKNAGFAFRGECNVYGQAIQFVNTGLKDPRITQYLTVADGVTTVNAAWSHSINAKAPPTIVCSITNANLVSAKGLNAMTAKWKYDIKLGANNTTDPDSAVFALGGGVQCDISAVPTFTVDARGKAKGVYNIIKASPTDGSAPLAGGYKALTNEAYAANFTILVDETDEAGNELVGKPVVDVEAGTIAVSVQEPDPPEDLIYNLTMRGWTTGNSPYEGYPTCTTKSGRTPAYSYWDNAACTGTPITVSSATAAGVYYVKAETAYEYHAWSASSAVAAFIVYEVGEEPTWEEIRDLTLESWVAGEAPKTPSCTTASGRTPTYTYWSNMACTEGQFTPALDTASGTYYLKAELAAGDKVTSAQAIISFEVYPASSVASGAYRLAQTGDWTSAASWDWVPDEPGASASGDYPRSMQHTVLFERYLDGLSVDLGGSAFAAGSVVVGNAENQLGKLYGVSNGSIIGLKLATTEEDAGTDVKLAAPGAGLLFTGDCTVRGTCFWAMYKTKDTTLVVKDGTTVFDFYRWSFLASSTSAKFTLKTENAIFRSTTDTSMSSLALPVSFYIELGDRNKERDEEGAEAAIQMSSYNASAEVQTLTVDCTGKGPGYYPLIHCPDSLKIEALASKDKTTLVGNDNDYFWDVVSEDDTLYLILSDTELPVTDEFHLLATEGEWCAASTWDKGAALHDWPVNKKDKVFIDAGHAASTVDLAGETVTIKQLINYSSADMTFENGELNLKGSAYHFIQNETASTMTFRNMTVGDPTQGGDELSLCGKDMTLWENRGAFRFEGDCTVSPFRIAAAGGRLVVADGTTTFANPNWSHNQSKGVVTIATENGIAKFTSGVNSLARAWCFDVTLGTNNVSNGEAAIQLSSYSTSSADASTIRVDARGMKTGIYGLVSVGTDSSGRIAKLPDNCTEVLVDEHMLYSIKTKKNVCTLYYFSDDQQQDSISNLVVQTVEEGSDDFTPSCEVKSGRAVEKYTFWKDAACTAEQFTPDFTTPAGTYYVKAFIEMDETWSSVEVIAPFTISPYTTDTTDNFYYRASSNWSERIMWRNVAGGSEYPCAATDKVIFESRLESAAVTVDGSYTIASVSNACPGGVTLKGADGLTLTAAVFNDGGRIDFNELDAGGTLTNLAGGEGFGFFGDSVAVAGAVTGEEEVELYFDLGSSRTNNLAAFNGGLSAPSVHFTINADALESGEYPVFSVAGDKTLTDSMLTNVYCYLKYAHSGTLVRNGDDVKLVIADCEPQFGGYHEPFNDHGSCAKDKEYFLERWNLNSGSFGVDYRGGSVTFTDGELYINNDFMATLRTTPTDGFRIEMDVTVDSGDSGGWVGMFFGGQRYSITGAGYSLVQAHGDSINNAIGDFQYGEKVHLKLERIVYDDSASGKLSIMVFYINDEMVFSKLIDPSQFNNTFYISSYGLKGRIDDFRTTELAGTSTSKNLIFNSGFEHLKYGMADYWQFNDDFDWTRPVGEFTADYVKRYQMDDQVKYGGERSLRIDLKKCCKHYDIRPFGLFSVKDRNGVFSFKIKADIPSESGITVTAWCGSDQYEAVTLDTELESGEWISVVVNCAALPEKGTYSYAYVEINNEKGATGSIWIDNMMMEIRDAYDDGVIPEYSASFFDSGRLDATPEGIPEKEADEEPWHKRTAGVVGRYNYYMEGDETAAWRITDADGNVEDVTVDISDMPVGTNEVVFTDSKGASHTESVVKLPRVAGAVQVNQWARCLVWNGRKQLFTGLCLNPVGEGSLDGSEYEAKFELLATNGFEYVHIPSDFGDAAAKTRVALDAAASRGMRVMNWWHDTTATPPGMEPTTSERPIEEIMEVFAGYTNILSHMILDEPELLTPCLSTDGVTMVARDSAWAQSRLEWAKANYPHTPIQANNTVLASGIPAGYGGNKTDIFMIDDYLTNRENRKMYNMIASVEMMIEADPGKPAMFLCAGDNSRLHYRIPSYREQLAQSWAFLCAGCSGISWYINFPNTEGNWLAMIDFNREAQSLADVILSETVCGEASFSASREAIVSKTAVDGDVEDGKFYVFSASMNPNTLEDVRITLPDDAPESGVIQVLFENREIEYSNRTFTDTYEGYARHIYRVKPPESGKPVVDGKEVDPADVFKTARSDRPIYYPSAPVLSGEAGSQTIVYDDVMVSVPVYYTAESGEGTGTYAGMAMISVKLNANSLGEIAAEGDTPAITIADGEFSVHLKGAYPTILWYGLKYATAVGGKYTAGELEHTADPSVELPSQSAGFFKVYVTDIPADQE